MDERTNKSPAAEQKQCEGLSQSRLASRIAGSPDNVWLRILWSRWLELERWTSLLHEIGTHRHNCFGSAGFDHSRLVLLTRSSCAPKSGPMADWHDRAWIFTMVAFSQEPCRSHI